MSVATARSLASPADLAGRRVAVLGLARSGVAAARFLVGAGAAVTVYDRRPRDLLADAVAALDGLPLQLALGVSPDAARALLADVDLVVTSPSISPQFPTTDDWLREALVAAMYRGVQLVSEVDLFLRLTPARVLAVTGTKGKTTVTALLGAMLERGDVPHLVGGNIGTPLIDRVGELGPDGWAVLELSELQLPTISRGADVSLYTNVMADHLDRHGTLEAYRAVKARLARMARGPIVLNVDDPGCRELGERLFGVSLHRYGLAHGEARVADGMLVLCDVPLMPAADVPLPGEHMLRNVLGASLAASLVGADPAAIADAIRHFPGVPHRLETIGEWGGAQWVNDSQATIPAAAIAALQAFAPRRVVLIAGGSDKGLDYAAFADAVAERCRAAILIGQTAAELSRLIAGRVAVEHVANLEEAVARAHALACPGDVVLLSPAAASFDMFTDYAERGDAFRAAAERIGREQGA
jgi:UDP-N-acetylmuramoylalanine--D-glutamate ligase